MSVPGKLVDSAGNWTGENRLHDQNTGSPQNSSSTARVTPVLGGRFLRLDYTWTYRDKPQEGSLLVGGEEGARTATAHWIDTWHMSHAGMACAGRVRDDGGIDVRGTYAAPPGPDWGWRIEVSPGKGETLRIVMFNITPDGREEPAVEASYRRSGGATTK